jgi:hypothetical protein
MWIFPNRGDPAEPDLSWLLAPGLLPFVLLALRHSCDIGHAGVYFRTSPLVSCVRHWNQMQIRFALALLAMTALAQQKQKFEITEVRATGCVRRAPQSDCLLLETLDGKTIYSFTAAPKPDLGTVITIQGRSHQGRSACKQGIPIDLVDWEPTDQMCVSEPKAK